MTARIAAGIESSALIRRVQAEGGFGAVLQKGDASAGTLLVVLSENGTNMRAYERMPMPDGTRNWHCSKQQEPEKPQDFNDYLTRRGGQDRDLWIIELDIPDGERFIGLPSRKA